MSILRHLLWPFALMHGMILIVRHLLFDWGLFESKRAPMKTIVFGNVAAGGTGKTPHTAFLLQQMAQPETWAFLSRGYGRNTRGFKKIDTISTAKEVGDEPMMLALKFPHIKCFVGEKRLDALGKIKMENHVKVVILDDALQHRALIPDCAIVLTTYQAPFHSDHLLPVGYLRDLKGRVKCAHIIVVTKCPNLISPHEHNVWRQKLKLLPHQILFFSRIVYGQIATFDGLQPIKHGDSVQLVSGIADDALFVAHVSSTYVVKKHWKYPDHKIFELKDINDWVKNESGQHIAVLTTEKDAVRLKSMKLPVNMTIYYVPITIEFIGENEDQRFIKGVQTLLN